MRIYKRLNCTIEIQDVAEKVLVYQNVNIDQFANHLYLFATNQPIEGSSKLTVRCSRTYTGEAGFSIGFKWFTLPKHLVPKPLGDTEI
jgi:hypothetical protein